MVWCDLFDKLKFDLLNIILKKDVHINWNATITLQHQALHYNAYYHLLIVTALLYESIKITTLLSL